MRMLVLLYESANNRTEMDGCSDRPAGWNATSTGRCVSVRCPVIPSRKALINYLIKRVTC